MSQQCSREICNFLQPTIGFIHRQIDVIQRNFHVIQCTQIITLTVLIFENVFIVCFISKLRAFTILFDLLVKLIHLFFVLCFFFCTKSLFFFLDFIEIDVFILTFTSSNCCSVFFCCYESIFDSIKETFLPSSHEPINDATTSRFQVLKLFVTNFLLTTFLLTFSKRHRHEMHGFYRRTQDKAERFADAIDQRIHEFLHWVDNFFSNKFCHRQTNSTFKDTIQRAHEVFPTTLKHVTDVFDEQTHCCLERFQRSLEWD